MIVSFLDKDAETLWLKGRSRRLPPDVCRRALGKFQSLHQAENIERMGLPPSSFLKKLGGDLKDFWSVRINDRWRLIFRFHDGDAFDVRIVDCH